MTAMTEPVKEAIVESAKNELLSRSEQVFQIMQIYTGGSQGKGRFNRVYPTRLTKLKDEQFQVLVSQLESAVTQSRQDAKGDNQFRGDMIKPFFELLDKLLDQFPDSPPPRVSGGLFGDAKE